MCSCRIYSNSIILFVSILCSSETTYSRLHLIDFCLSCVKLTSAPAFVAVFITFGTVKTHKQLLRSDEQKRQLDCSQFKACHYHSETSPDCCFLLHRAIKLREFTFMTSQAALIERLFAGARQLGSREVHKMSAFTTLVALLLPGSSSLLSPS